MPPDFADRLRRLLSAYHGEGTPVAVRYCSDEAEARLRLGEQWCVEPSDDLLQRLREEIAADEVRLRYPNASAA